LLLPFNLVKDLTYLHSRFLRKAQDYFNLQSLPLSFFASSAFSHAWLMAETTNMQT